MAPHLSPMHVQFEGQAQATFAACQSDYRASLAAPEDDMWAAFKALAEPYAIRVDQQPAGCASIDAARELHHFQLHAEFEDRAEALFQELVHRLEVQSAVPSTVDPFFLSLCIELARTPVPVALMYRLAVASRGAASAPVRAAAPSDHASAVAFAKEAADLPEAFLGPYFNERIARGELFLHEGSGVILATGECRLDVRCAGHAHLGLIVARARRGQGMGTAVMGALVEESRRRGLEPLCSTEPSNLAAQRVIERSGFRARHRVFRFALGPMGR